MTWICIHCGNELTGSKTHFCNRKCQSQYRKQEKKFTKNCKWCKQEYRTSNNRQRFCSPSCASKANMTGRSGSRNNGWKGGISRHTKGYIYEYAPDHPNADKRGYILQHRKVAGEKLGRPLKPEEVPHHVDGNKANNSPDNLWVFPTPGAHSKEEARLRRERRTG